MIKLRIGGVPEHFNLPWHLALEARRFESLGIEVAWRDYPGGSGAMAKALRDGELDAALLLTEGAVAAVADGVAAQDREPLHRFAARLGHPRAGGLALSRRRGPRAARAMRSAARARDRT